MSMLELSHVKKSFKENPVIRDISISVEQGDVVAVLGPSGSGKTTLLRCAGYLSQADGGTVTLDGETFDLHRISKRDVVRYRRKIGFVFQSFNLFGNKTALQNVTAGLTIARKMDKKEAERIGLEALEKVGLLDRKDYYPSKLSGGQQQRVAIARALVNRPQVLLLDEPLGALDLKLRKGMQIELKRMQQRLGITFVFVTHDQEEALTMSDTIVVMNEGTIQQIGTPTDIYNEPKNVFVAKFIGESNIMPGTMKEDFLVNFHGRDFECVDKGFRKNEPVDVVIRPEDIDFVAPEKGMFRGTVKSVLFMGVHYEFRVDCGEVTLTVHSTDYAEPGSEVGIEIVPDAIHIMHKSDAPEAAAPDEAEEIPDGAANDDRIIEN